MSKPVRKPTCEAIIDLFPEPFVVIDRHYNIVSANREYKAHYQVGPEGIVGKHCYEVSHNYSRPCSQEGEPCPLEEVIRTGKPTTVMHIHCTCEHEEHVQISAAPIMDEDGEVVYMGETICPINDHQNEDPLLIGHSPSILKLTSILYRVAPTSSTVLLLGDSGSGKDCAARYIHQQSSRSNKPFIVVDCGALGDSLIESELFGYEKGSFTGANQRKIGLIETANGGTLFIDEIGELPSHLQTKLLRVLETGTIRRIGGTEYINVDVRIIAATNRDLQHMVQEKTFRQDLYFRLSAFPINLPTLKERKQDIPELAEYFLKHIEEGEQQIPLSNDVIEKLLIYDYPGNVRELRNIVERAVILAAGNAILPDFIVFEHEPDLYEVEQHAAPVREPSSFSSSRITTEDVLDALYKTGGHRAEAAQLLGVSERTVYRHIKNMEQPH